MSNFEIKLLFVALSSLELFIKDFAIILVPFVLLIRSDEFHQVETDNDVDKLEYIYGRK